MFRSPWRLFRLLGVPINVDVSWLIILALLTWTLASLFAHEMPDWPWPAYVAMGLGTALAFFACIVLHELGHAAVARAFGIPIRGITLFLFGGVAEIEGEPKSARDEFLVAIAGPAVSAVLAAGCWLAAAAAGPGPAGLVLATLAAINLTVTVFNLVPAFPLDGGRMLRAVLWAALDSLRRATYFAALCGRGFGWLLIALGLFNLLAGQIFQGVWLSLIGIFLHNAARASYRQMIVRQMLRGEPVARFMTREPIVVPPQLDLQHWVGDYVFRYHRKLFPVAANGHVEGVITTRALARYPQAEWSAHTVGEVMRHDVRALCIAPDADALDALEKMQRRHSSRLLVMDRDHLVGVVSLKDLLRFLDLKLELEEEHAPAPPSRG